MKYLKDAKTIEELKKLYRAWTKKLHPDCGGSKEEMQQLNAEYEEKFEILKKAHNAAADENHQTTETPNEFIEIIEKLIHLDGLEIELCGSWLWIGGNTYSHKEELKAAGCIWSKNKGRWYWRHEEQGRKHYKGTKTLDEIRFKYGSQLFTAEPLAQLA